MPTLFEGSQSTGTLRPEIAAEWGVPASAVVAGGAGDNAAGAVGVGVVEPGAAFLSLGTSGVLFVSNAGYAPNPEQAVHAFCHCLPDTWHQMSVILSAASCLTWLSGVLGTEVPALMDEVAAADRDTGNLIFLPYLTGERTPHNDPSAMGVFFGLTAATERADMTRAVLEGVAFAFADGQAALEAAGTEIGVMSVIGGGARSQFWGEILASALGRPLTYHKGGEVGPAFGAARLGRLAASGEDPVAVCTRPPADVVVEPIHALHDVYQAKWSRYRELYRVLKGQFSQAQA
jgi:xylulokinase